MKLKELLIILIDSYELNKSGIEYKDECITYINWWKNNLDKQWFTSFIENTVGEVRKPIYFYSVFGPHRLLKQNREGLKIFYTGENIENRVLHSALNERKDKVLPLERRAKKYRSLIEKDNMDLILTFCADNFENAIKFPYWLLTHFDACYSLDDVQKKMQEIEERYHKIDVTRKMATVISSHDFFGIRANICDAIGDIVEIKYAGKWRNNSDELWNECSNDKLRYLSKYRFNICPENMDAKEYVTEKIWDSFEAGCIPIYGGANGKPEPRIFNKNAFINWSFDGDEYNLKNIEKIKKLLDDDYYKEFKEQKIFIEGADEYIFSLISDCSKKIKDLLI